MMKFISSLLLVLFLWFPTNHSIQAQNPEYELLGTSVCKDDLLAVPIVVRHFSDIISVQFSVEWDTTLLSMEGISMVEPNVSDALFNTNGMEEGVMAFSWMDVDFQGLALADDTPLFVLNFKSKSEGGDTTDIYFSNMPSIIETVQTINGVFTQVMSTVIDTEVLGYHPILGQVDIQPSTNGMDGSIDLEVTGGLAPYQYSWSNGSELEDIDQLMPAIYECEVVDALSCSNTLGPFQVDQIMDIAQLSESIAVTFGPNPIQNHLRVNLALTHPKKGIIRLIDLVGRIQKVHTFDGIDIQAFFELHHFPKGVAWLEIQVEEQRWIEKVLIL